MSNTSKHHDSSTSTVDEGGGYESPVRRKSTIKNKVTKLRSSTKSLFSRSKVKKEGSRVSGISSVLERRATLQFISRFYRSKTSRRKTKLNPGRSLKILWKEK